MLSRGLPFLGHTTEFLWSPLDLLHRAHREAGAIAAFNVLGRRMVAMFGPAALQVFFRAPDSELSPSEAYKIMAPVFGKEVVYDAPPDRMDEQSGCCCQLFGSGGCARTAKPLFVKRRS